MPIYSVSASRDYRSTTDWREICLLVESVLYNSCNIYVDYDDGDLTAEGERVYCYE